MREFPFQKRFRIKKSEFKEFFKNSKRISDKSLYIFYQFNTKNPKIGTIVKRKNRTSVIRNKLKRQIKEIFRLNKHYIDNYTIVIGVKQNEEMDYDRLEKSFMYLLKRAGCLKH